MAEQYPNIYGGRTGGSAPCGQRRIDPYQQKSPSPSADPDKAKESVPPQSSPFLPMKKSDEEMLLLAALAFLLYKNGADRIILAALIYIML